MYHGFSIPVTETGKEAQCTDYGRGIFLLPEYLHPNHSHLVRIARGVVFTENEGQPESQPSGVWNRQNIAVNMAIIILM